MLDDGTCPRIRVTVQLSSGGACEDPSAEACLARLLGKSPFWETITLHEREAIPPPNDRTDILIVPPSAAKGVPCRFKIVRLRETLDRESLAPQIQDGYFACTSEAVREGLLAWFPGIRHRTYVVPTSFPAADGKMQTTPENETAHWQELIRALTRRREIPRADLIPITALQPREIQSARALTVVISSEGMDERLANCLDRISPQTEAMDAELLVGLKTEPGAEAARWPHARFYYAPAGNVLSLRARGISMATGEVVALMEDHGLPGKDWCQRVVDAHRAHPHIPVIYGPVMHGGPFGITSWANFLVNYGLFMPPLEFPPRRRVPPIVGTTIKRSYLPEGDLAEGWFEFIDMAKYHDLGLCRNEDSLLVRHIQHHGLVGTYEAHFHNARVTTGSRKLVRGSPEWKQQLRNSFRVPVQLIGIDWAEIWALKRRRGLLLKTLPSYVAIVLAHTLGEIIGLFFGSGRSADHID